MPKYYDQDCSLASFTKIFIETMNKHAPIKKNILAQITQILLQKVYGAIMLRSRLWNIFLKEKYLKLTTTQHLR